MLAQSVADILKDHVRLSVEGIDRMYLNVFVPGLQYEQGIVRFFRAHRGQPLPSAALMAPMTRRFVTKLEGFVAQQAIPLVAVRQGERKSRPPRRRGARAWASVRGAAGRATATCWAGR